jgi:hypothetical protein
VFARALKLLAGNWLIVVPGLVAGGLYALVSAILRPSTEQSGVTATVIWFLASALQLIASIVSIAYTTGMAQAAWERGEASFADGYRAFSRDAGHVFVAMVGMIVTGLLAVWVSQYTYGLGLAVYVFFFIYTMPAAVVGEEGGFHAMVQSAQLALRRPVTTGLMVLLLAVIVFGVTVLAAFLWAAPLVGPLVAAVLSQTLIGYLTLVIVGEYLALRPVLRA